MARIRSQAYGTTVAPPPGELPASAIPEARQVLGVAPGGPAPDALGFPETTADEMAFLNILRLLNEASGPRLLTVVEQAFIAGAKTAFEQLVKACDQMLQKAPPAYGVGLAAAAEAPSATKSSGGGVRRTSPRRSNEATA